ncbi:hypothetical protein F2P81_023710 [Scophthalmus maximus]|uniref:Uncharacterized protein n=1 Tax=Scophthalmus maximus TaxID=52904 RepID=A0A6A4RUN3_SCOMX|nr:hypothetical protein F2P81_023710 [Scophthalmus maximus]
MAEILQSYTAQSRGFSRLLVLERRRKNPGDAGRCSWSRGGRFHRERCEPLTRKHRGAVCGRATAPALVRRNERSKNLTGAATRAPTESLQPPGALQAGSDAPRLNAAVAIDDTCRQDNNAATGQRVTLLMVVQSAGGSIPGLDVEKNATYDMKPISHKNNMFLCAKCTRLFFGFKLSTGRKCMLSEHGTACAAGKVKQQIDLFEAGFEEEQIHSTD